MLSAVGCGVGTLIHAVKKSPGSEAYCMSYNIDDCAQIASELSQSRL